MSLQKEADYLGVLWETEKWVIFVLKNQTNRHYHLGAYTSKIKLEQTLWPKELVVTRIQGCQGPLYKIGNSGI